MGKISELLLTSVVLSIGLTLYVINDLIDSIPNTKKLGAILIIIYSLMAIVSKLTGKKND